MKPIIIKESNIRKIEETLETVQKRCTARTISYAAIAGACNEVVQKLGIKKKHLKGVKIDVDINAQDFPRAYKYTPESTHFCAEYTTSGWKLSYVGRLRCRPSKSRFIVTLTDEARAAVLESMTRFE